MKEIWRDIDGYEGRYQISNLGNVKSLRYAGGNTERNLVPKCNNSGRLWVELIDGKRKKCMLIHRLVAIAFIPNPDNLPQINHIDENPKNNVVDNLEWCTGSYNVRTYMANHPDFYKKRRPRRPSGMRYQKQTWKKIDQLTPDGELVKSWSCARDVEVELGWSAWSISECCRGNRHKAYGYFWRYAS